MTRSFGLVLLSTLSLPFACMACEREDGLPVISDEATANNGTAGGNGQQGSSGGDSMNGDPGANAGNGSGGNADPSTGSETCSPPGQQCTCANGQMGFQACTQGMLDECTCSIDLSDAGLPPPSECPADSMCRSTMGLIMGVDGFCAGGGGGGGGSGMNGGGLPGPGLPPMCTSDDDCDQAGLPDATCQALMLPIVGAQRLCLQTCVP